MKLMKIEVIDGSIHFGDKIYTKGDVFEIDEKHAKNLIENKVAKEFVKVEIEAKAKNVLPNVEVARDSTADQGVQDGKDAKDIQAEVFGKINEDLQDPNKDKGKK